jgi:hypothetical protein
MIKKNDCVPKKVLNQQKLRRQAVAVMIGGLIIAFLFGLIVGWFIPKNDKKNVTASAEVIVPDTNPQASFYPVVGDFSFAPLFSFTLFDSSANSSPRVSVYTLFIEINSDASSVGVSFGYRTLFSTFDETFGFVSGYSFFRIPFDFSGVITRAQLIASSGTDLSPILSYTKGETSETSFSVGAVIPHRVNLSLGRFSYFFNNGGENVLTPSFALELGSGDKSLTISDTVTQSVPVSSSVSFSSLLTPIYVTSDGTSFNPNLVYTRQEYLNYGSTQFTFGKNEGYNSGYAAGVAAGGNNNFMSLITAVVDAPIKAFTSLLDFEILGYNMKNLALALLTAGLLVAAIRFFSRL